MSKAENNRQVQIHQLRRGVRAYLHHKATGDPASLQTAAKNLGMTTTELSNAANRTPKTATTPSNQQQAAPTSQPQPLGPLPGTPVNIQRFRQR